MTSPIVRDADAAIAFLGRVPWKEISSVRPERGDVGVFVCPWQGTAVPWFNLVLGILLRGAGHRVTLLVDDQAFEAQPYEASQFELISRVLSEVPDALLPAVRISALEPSCLSLAEADRIETLAFCNLIRARMTSVGADPDSEAAREISQRLHNNYLRIKTAVAQTDWSFLVAPGGLYANSGLYLLAGRSAGLRVATYDAGYGRLFVGSDDVACYFYDDLRTLEWLLSEQSPDSPTLAPLIEASRQEFDARLAGDDAQKFQTVGAGASGDLPYFDAVIPMSIDWDAPGLARNRFFSSPAEWVRETVEYLMTRTQATVAFRQHPYIRHVDWWDKQDGYRELLADLLDRYPDRLVFYEADAKVNTYELISHSKVVLPYVSAIGIEAAFLGKPIIVESSAHYSRLPFVHRPADRDDYYRMIEEGIAGRLPAPSADAVAIAFLYFHLFQTAHYLFTDFTPQPNDFASWVAKPFEALACDQDVQVLLASLANHVPISRLVIAEKRAPEKQTPAKAHPPADSRNEDINMKHDSRLAERFPDVTFGDHVQVIGLANTVIDRGTCIGDDSWLNICQRDQETRMKIGANVLVGRQNMLSSGAYLEIGDFCLFAPRVYVSSADHCFEDIARPIMLQGATLDRRLVVEENCWLGINAVVSGNLTVGRGSVVAANSVVNWDVPPFCVVAGSPARIIKMYNPRLGAWVKTPTDAQIREVNADRALAGLPTREEYKAMLSPYVAMRLLDPIVAGRGESI